jgi:hypothetical protein
MAACLAVAVLPAQAAAASAASRLAQAFCEQVAAVAAGRPVELAPVEDRSGRGASFALDLSALVGARLGGRVALAQQGARLRIAPVLTEGAGRLVLSARVVEEPEGRLIDILSASVETAGEALPLIPARAPAASEVDVASLSWTPPLDGPVLELAWLRDDELAVLAPAALTLYRLAGSTLSPAARQAVAASLPARAPAGTLLPTGDDSLWLLSNRGPGAVLFMREGGRLVRRSEAEALPWPGSRTGLRYRPGTNLLEGDIPGLGDGPFLKVLAGGAAGVRPDGRLLLPRGLDAGHPVGPSLAPLWPPLLAAASADPPGPTDRLLLVDSDNGRTAEGLRVDGAIRAVATRVTGQAARVALGVAEPGGASRVVLVDLRRREP